MKERMIYQSEAQMRGRVDLTPKANPYTLKVSAMPEQQEGPSQVNPVEKPQEARGEYTSEQSPSVRAMWEKWAEGQPQDVGTTATINKLIELGIPPTLGEMGIEENPEDVGTREEIVRTRKEEQLTPEPVFAFDTSTITDPKLRVIADRIMNRPGVFAGDMRRISRDFEEVESMTGVPQDQKQYLVEEIGKMAQEALRKEQDEQREQNKGRNFFNLQREDLVAIEKGPIEWLDEKFDLFYDTAKRGDELQSPVLESLQRAYAEAARYMEITPELRKKIPEFSRKYNTQIGVLLMRANVETRSIENIQDGAKRLGAGGLLTALSFGDGLTESMYNRMADRLEDDRLRLGGRQQHLYSESVSLIESDLIEEQKLLLDKKLTEEEKADEVIKITRAVRIAYNVLVASQREAVIASRGEHAPDTLTYYSDPGAAFNIYNYEDFLTAKFHILNAEDEEFLREIKLSMADQYLEDSKQRVGSEKEREELGKRLFRDLFAVSDFYSSKWRIHGMLEKSEQVYKYKLAVGLGIIKDREAYSKIDEQPESEQYKSLLKSAKNFGLFMRLKDAGKGERAEIWGKIREYRPEEIARLFRERNAEDNGFQNLFKNPVFDSIDYKGEDKREYKFLKENYFGEEKYLDMGPEVLEKLMKMDSVKLEELTNQLNSIKSTGNLLTNLPPDQLQKLKELGLDEEEIVELPMDKTEGLTEEKLKAFNKYKNKFSLEQRKRLREQYRVFLAQTKYDGFKKEYGAIISRMREDAMKGEFPINIKDKDGKDVLMYGIPQQLNFASLTPEQKERLVGYLRVVREVKTDSEVKTEAENLIEMFKAMQRFATPEKIKDLSKGEKFDDIYTRTLWVDDIQLKDLEVVPEGSGITPIAEVWSKDRGGDALVRNMNDTANAMKAGAALLGFLKNEDMDGRIKSAEEFAEAASNFIGQSGRAKGIRYTVGTLFNLAKKEWVWDVLGIERLKNRKPTSRLQKIYGPQAASMGREELRGKLDHIRLKLVANAQQLTEEELLLPEEKQKEIRKKNVHKAEEEVQQLTRILEVDKKGFVKLYLGRGLIALMVIAMFEAMSIADLKGLAKSAS